MARFFCLRSIIKSKLDKSNERNDRLFDIVLLVSKKSSTFVGNLSHVLNTLLIISAILLLLSVMFARGKWYAPTNLMLGVWIVSLISYAVFDQGIHPLSSSTIWAVVLWLSGFCFAAWSVQSVYIKPIFEKVTSSVPSRDIYYYFTLFTVPIMIVWVISIVIRSGSNPFSALRDANVAGTNGIRTTVFFVVFWLVSYIMELQVVSRENIGRVILLLLVNLFYAVISMGKMNFMIVFLSTAIILSYKKIIRLHHLFILFGVLLVLFVGIQKIRGSYTNPRHFAGLYLTTNLANLDQNVAPNSSEISGENTFRLYYAIRSSLDGGKSKVINPILKFQKVEVGNQVYFSNTYTGIYPFYKDFGLIGVACFAIILGLLFGYLFKSAEDGSEFAFVVYAIFSGILIMSFIGDTFFTVLSQNIQYLIAALLPYIISKYNLFNKYFKQGG